jgi:hypothetical protein
MEQSVNTVTISPKFQVAIPREIRERLSVESCADKSISPGGHRDVARLPLSSSAALSPLSW